MSYFVIFLYAMLFHVSSIMFSSQAGFNAKISDEVIFYSTMDHIISFVVVYLVLQQFQWFKRDSETVISDWYITLFEKNKFFIFIIVLFAAFLAYKSVQLILSGALRHQLLTEHETGGLAYMAVSSFFKILVPMVFFFKTSFNLKILAIAGLLFSIMITASRSELAYVIKFFMILLLFANHKTIYKKLGKFTAIASTMVIAAVLSTSLLQNRPISDGFGAFYDIFISQLTYGTYGYYLSEISLEASSSIEKGLFGFFGYVSEFGFRFVSPPSAPIDSAFVGELHNLGTSKITGRPFLANVGYPWWTWFVGTFGFAGLIIKAVFVYILLYILMTVRFVFTIVLLLSFVILGVMATHPLLTLTHTFNFVVAISIDVIVLLFSKRRHRVVC